MKRFVYFCLLVLLFSCKKEEAQTQEQNILEKIANAHGFENWDNIEQLEFTFNVDRGGKQVASRSWIWKPKDYTVQADSVQYNINESIPEEYIPIDQGFVNDKYWLLAPFQLIWDQENFTFSELIDQKAPVSGEIMNKLTIVYNNEGGYTPGDAYDFYFEDDYLIKEWTFRKGNTDEPSLSTTWENYATVQGLKLAQSYKNKDSFHLYFTDLN